MVSFPLRTLPSFALASTQSGPIKGYGLLRRCGEAGTLLFFCEQPNLLRDL